MPTLSYAGAGCPPGDTATTPLPGSRAGAALLSAHAGLFIVTLVVLGAAIGWPDVLREPPSVVLQRIAGATIATKLGYTSYLLSSMLMIPIAFLMRDLFVRSRTSGWQIDSLAFIGAAAGVLKAMGIVRWLSAMPALAGRYETAHADIERQIVEGVYVGVNAYGGSIGEVLGVHLFSGLWFLGISLVLWRVYGKSGVGLFGLVVAAMTLALASRPFFPEVGVLEIIGGPLWLLWLFVLAITLWRGRA